MDNFDIRFLTVNYVLVDHEYGWTVFRKRLFVCKCDKFIRHFMSKINALNLMKLPILIDLDVDCCWLSFGANRLTDRTSTLHFPLSCHFYLKLNVNILLLEKI